MGRIEMTTTADGTKSGAARRSLFAPLVERELLHPVGILYGAARDMAFAANKLPVAVIETRQWGRLLVVHERDLEALAERAHELDES
jgi:hypothetical protein